MNKTITYRILIGCMAFAFGTVLMQSDGDARRFRSLNRIATPEKLPEGAIKVEPNDKTTRFKQVDRRLVIKAINSLANAWNTGKLDPMLATDRFYNKDRLLDTLIEVAPRDAVLKVQSVSGISTLEQYFQKQGGYNKQVSVVSAIVRTQIEFNDPRQGFVTLNGRSEFTLEIIQ